MIQKESHKLPCLWGTALHKLMSIKIHWHVKEAVKQSCPEHVHHTIKVSEFRSIMTPWSAIKKSMKMSMHIYTQNSIGPLLLIFKFRFFKSHGHKCINQTLRHAVCLYQQLFQNGLFQIPQWICALCCNRMHQVRLWNFFPLRYVTIKFKKYYCKVETCRNHSSWAMKC